MKIIILIACVLLSFHLYTIQNVIKDINSYKQVKTIPYVKNKVKGIQITKAIIQLETGGKPVKGLSGEHGVAQFLPSTWRNYTKTYLATTTLPLTPENEFEVLTLKNIDLLNKGYTPYQIALVHNQGHPGKCSKGVNKLGVPFNSCDYAKKVVSMIR